MPSQSMDQPEIICLTLKRHRWTILKKSEMRFSRRNKMRFKCLLIAGFVPKNMRFKVTMYLQECLASKRCSASALSCGYLKPYIKLKLLELVIKLYKEFWKWIAEFFTTTKCQRPDHLLKCTSRSEFRVVYMEGGRPGWPGYPARRVET